MYVDQPDCPITYPHSLSRIVMSFQVMAVKDRYGRHLKGSDKIVKQVKDYVVFERHIVNKYGRWKVCGKVFPLTATQQQQQQPVEQAAQL